MGWRDRDWARFTDSEREMLYGRASGPTSVREPMWQRPVGQRRSVVAPGATFAIVVSAAALLLGQIPRGNPFVPALHINLSSLTAPHHQFPLNLPTTATYGTVLTLNGTDGSSASGRVVAVGQWNGGPPTTLANGAVALDHSWSLPISLSQHGTLNLTINLPSGNTLAGTVTIP